MAKKKSKPQQESIEKELSDINDAAGDLMELSHCASAYKLYGELRTRAKAENHLGYYVFGTFFQMNLSQRLLQFDNVRERAVELIAIFEDEEQARRIDPSLDLDQYENLIYMMGACAYEVLAEATGELEGYNSEGMQECLTGGIEVCHRIGKLSCIQCFREYACDTHTAADDYELSRYHCNQVLQHDSDFPERGDRRWLAMMRLGDMDILEGQHESARAKLEQAAKLACEPSVNDSSGAQICVAMEQYLLDLLDGQELDKGVEEIFHKLPPRNECPEFDLDMDLRTAIGLIMHQQWDEAETLLVDWNKRLKQGQATTRWLETGILLCALYRLRGDTKRMQRLAKQYEEVATKANDWQTIRRLHLIRDESAAITPLGTVVRNTRAAKSLPHAEPESVATKESAQAVESTRAQREPTPMSRWLDDWTDRLQVESQRVVESPDVGDLSHFHKELIDQPASAFTDPEDIGRALFFMNMVITPDCDRSAIWKWANRLVASHQDVSYLISLLGRLGMTISMLDRLTSEIQMASQEPDDASGEDDEDSDPFRGSSISNERLDQLVRKSLQMDATGVNNNFRAAEVFEYIGNAGEAERCYARAFKLDRTREDAALALSRIYTETDRLQDALYVLDLCIREGGDTAELLFEAALKAYALTQHELQVSYLQKLHERHSPAPWTYYYLSSGLLELKRPQEALEAIEQEVSLFGSAGLHIDSVRAAAYAQLGQSEEAASQIRLALEHPLSKITNLTTSGVSGAFERLIAAAKMCPNERALQVQIEDRMLKAGLATESFFEQSRAHEKPCDLYLYQCYMSQPLDAEWSEFEGCLPDQVDWESYVAQWGILARDGDEAAEIAMEWQGKCYPVEPVLMEVESTEELLHDRPGVAFQGPRFSEAENDEGEEASDDHENPDFY